MIITSFSAPYFGASKTIRARRGSIG
ncbi:hypothetical protein D018_3770A, partial [Vibrio parahaemolyticus VP2007-007]